MPELHEALKGLKSDDLRLDASGNIRIVNRDLAKKIADLAGLNVSRSADSDNYGTCNNTACIAPDLERLAAVNPAAHR